MAPMSKESPAPHGLDRRARLNLLLLASCQAIGQAANTMMFAATALSVVTFYPDRELATLPMTLQHLGIMLWVFPASLLMQRVGAASASASARCSAWRGRRWWAPASTTRTSC